MKRAIFLSSLIFFTSCATKPQQTLSTPSTILIKTDGIKIFDTGFVENNQNSHTIKVLNLGVQILEIKIFKEKTCLDLNCYKRDVFNQKYLSSEYENDFLEKLVLKKPIFNGENLIKEERGFSQTIKRNSKFDITYQVNENEIYFKDKVNKILIKIGKLNG